MNVFTLIICKFALFILKAMKRGSSYPGALAFKLNKNILNYFKLPELTIFVTGTTGKTSVSATLAEVYRNAGLKVGHNHKGSNLKDGVASLLLDCSDIFGKIKCDVLVVEIDERYVKEVFKYIKPKYFVINNLSRDQLARNGHFDIVWNEINSNITDSIKLVLNVDDPLVTKFSLDHSNYVFYGLAKTKYSKKKNTINSLDILYCPKCNKKMDFDFFHYGNLGHYSCSNCDFKRFDPKYEAKLICDDMFTVDNHKIKMNNTALYTVYNLLACYAVAKETNIATDSILKTFENLSLKIKRLDTFAIDNKEGVLLLSKNETPISYNQSIEYIQKQKENKTVAIGFKRISGRYDLKDLSWLYDINFELLNDDSIEKIICIGNFANDISVRLKLANVDTKKISICSNPDDTLDFIEKNSKGKIYCMFYFDMEKLFKKQLALRGSQK